MEVKKVKAELKRHEVGITKAFNRIMAGKTAQDSISDDELVFGKNINITGLRFCGAEEGYPSLPEYINGTVNCNMLGYSVKDGGCYNMFSGEPIMYYDPNEWFFFWFNYDQETDEESHLVAFNPETRKLDILHVNYSAPENWWIEKSTWLFK